MHSITISGADPNSISGLADLTLDCVHGGASIGFMASLDRSGATRFWEHSLAAADRGERVVLVARNEPAGQLVGTVQLILDMPDNQPHRADVAKLQVHRNARRQGLAERLMGSIEQQAREHARTLLVLDTVPGSPAEALYRKLGWSECGIIPGFALMPSGEPCDTMVFYKNLE